jgi:hypothetical protein
VAQAQAGDVEYGGGEGSSTARHRRAGCARARGKEVRDRGGDAGEEGHGWRQRWRRSGSLPTSQTRFTLMARSITVIYKNKLFKSSLGAGQTGNRTWKSFQGAVDAIIRSYKWH